MGTNEKEPTMGGGAQLPDDEGFQFRTETEYIKPGDEKLYSAPVATRFFAIEEVENSDVYTLYAGKLDMKCSCPFAPNQVTLDADGRPFQYRPWCNTTCPLVKLHKTGKDKGNYEVHCGAGNSHQVEIIPKTIIIADTKKGIYVPT